MVGEAEVRFRDALVGEVCAGDSGANDTPRLDCLRGFGFGVASVTFCELVDSSIPSMSTLVDLATRRDEGVVREDAFRLRLDDCVFEMT